MRTVRCSSRLLGGVSARHPPLWTEWQTPVKTLPCRKYAAGSKKIEFDNWDWEKTMNVIWQIDLDLDMEVQKHLR